MLRRTVAGSLRTVSLLLTLAFPACSRHADGQKTAPANSLALVGDGVARDGGPNATGTPVVVELFSSEGCSSCPPADDLLEELDRTGVLPEEGASNATVPVIAIEYHVDYWDQLGWKDPYADASYTERQRRYGKRLHASSLYTPQAVVDGRREFVGSREGQMKAIVRELGAMPHVPVVLSRSDDVLLLAAPGAAPGASWEVVTVERGLVSEVERGENEGRRLHHAPIARAVRKVAMPADGVTPARVDAPKKAGLAYAALLVASDGTILGAGESR
jgi:hypothetical protein